MLSSSNNPVKPKIQAKLRALIDIINSPLFTLDKSLGPLVINKKELCRCEKRWQLASSRLYTKNCKTPKQKERGTSRVSTANSVRERKTGQDKQNRECPKTGGCRSQISAKGWILYDVKDKMVVVQKNSHSKMEMASITKIMTLVTTLDLLSLHSICPEKLKLVIPQKAQNTNGTSANLKEGNILSLKDVFYGLMLPSGNDAAVTISLYMGTIVNCLDLGVPVQSMYDSHLLHSRMMKDEASLKTFLGHMNAKAQFLKMGKTHYANPHGLSNKNNYSTCRDLVKLCEYAIQNKQFVEIVGTKQYQARCLLTNTKYSWENTHKLLSEGWRGIKTGVTPAAGPCLTSYWEGKVGKQDREIIVVLLNSSSLEARWKETKLLKSYYLNSLR